jgi:heme exporter protein CcmD
MSGLGAYAGTVLGAYGVTIVALGLLVLVSWRRAARTRAALARAEAAATSRRSEHAAA